MKADALDERTLHEHGAVRNANGASPKRACSREDEKAREQN